MSDPDDLKRPRIEGTIVKHAPIKLVGQSSQDCFYISTKMPFVSALKKITKLLKSSPRQPNRKYLKVLGMGKCVEKALSVGLRFQEDGYRVEIFTGETTLFDEIKIKGDMEVDDESDEEVVKQKRQVSTIEVRIHKRD